MKKYNLILASLNCVFLSAASAATVDYAANNDTVVALSPGTLLAQGNLIRIGNFSGGNSFILSNSTDFTALDSGFVEFGTSTIGDNTFSDGLFSSSTTLNSFSGADSAIYLWFFDSANAATSLNHAIITAPNDIDWVFPTDTPPDVTSIDITDAFSDAGQSIVIGSQGSAVFGSFNGGNSTQYIALAPIPEPTALLLFGVAGLAGVVFRRRR